MSDEKRGDLLGELSSTPSPVAVTSTSISRRWSALVLSAVLAFVLWGPPLRIPGGFGSQELFIGADVKNSTLDLLKDDFDWYQLKASKNLTWTDCLETYKCARLILPLDYSTPDGPTTEIALLLRPAADPDNYKGTIFLNPGGPGGSGTNLLQRRGDMIAKYVGPEFALLGFDPRGTGASVPSAQCFGSDKNFRQWELQSLYSVLKPTNESFGEARSREKVMGEKCLAALGGNGKEEVGGTAEEWGPGRFMNTPNVVEDMVRILEQIGQEKMYYWGFSYGTVLGQYFSAMHPEKVGRVVIDGVHDAEEYRAGLWFSNLRDTDHVADSFYHFCHQAGPSKCPLYEPSPDAVKARVDAILLGLSQSPVPVPFAPSGPAIITRDFMHMKFFEAIHKPVDNFPTLANSFRAIETLNQTALESLANDTLSHKCECGAPDEDSWSVDTEAFYLVACGDTDPSDREDPSSVDFAAHYDNCVSRSSFAGSMWAIHRLRCLEWKMRSKWRYTDAFAGNTSHPILIVNPTWDTVCPLHDAKIVQKRYVGAGLLEQRSNGHCSSSAPSLCTAKVVREYFVNGTLPEEGTVCEPDVLPFVGRAGGEEGFQAMSVEDRELLVALEGLTDALPYFGL